MKTRTPSTLVEHAGSGFLIPEATARRIDALARELPRDFTYRRRAAAAELELNPGERTDISTITTDALDRQRECVLPAGGDWAGYNRVVPFAHDYRQLPAGSCWWIKPRSGTPGGLIAKTHYPPKPADWGDAPWLPSAILHLLQQPVPACTGKSIGFLPLNIREATREELSTRPELAGAAIIDRWAGIEYSVVPVPCNPEAEMLAVAKGVEEGVFDANVAELIKKAMEPFLLPAPAPEPAAAPLASPDCPRCGSSAGVTARPAADAADSAGTWICDYCGTTFDPPAPSEKSARTPELNHACYSRAESLIAAGAVTDAPWSFTAEDRRSASPDDFLGIDPSSPKEDERHWMYPVIKAAKVYRRAVSAAEGRASRYGATAIAEAASRLMQAIHAADAKAEKAAAVERAAEASFVRPETVRIAIRRAMEEAREQLPLLVRAELREAYARATGKA